MRGDFCAGLVAVVKKGPRQNSKNGLFKPGVNRLRVPNNFFLSLLKIFKSRLQFGPHDLRQFFGFEDLVQQTGSTVVVSNMKEATEEPIIDVYRIRVILHGGDPILL